MINVDSKFNSSLNPDLATKSCRFAANVAGRLVRR